MSCRHRFTLGVWLTKRSGRFCNSIVTLSIDPFGAAISRPGLLPIAVNAPTSISSGSNNVTLRVLFRAQSTLSLLIAPRTPSHSQNGTRKRTSQNGTATDASRSNTSGSQTAPSKPAPAAPSSSPTQRRYAAAPARAHCSNPSHGLGISSLSRIVPHQWCRGPTQQLFYFFQNFVEPV